MPDARQSEIANFGGASARGARSFGAQIRRPWVSTRHSSLNGRHGHRVPTLQLSLALARSTRNGTYTGSSLISHMWHLTQLYATAFIPSFSSSNLANEKFE